MKDELTAKHPVEFIQQNFDVNQDNMRLSMLALTQGQHAVMRINMERNLASRVWRGPGLPSSKLGLETLLGRDDMISFEDVLNGKCFQRTCDEKERERERVRESSAL